MRVRVEFATPYRAVRCTFCDALIHQRRRGWPGWVSELVGRYVFWRHTHTAGHRGNRPTGEPAPALVLDPEAFERRRTGGGGV